MSKTGRNTVWFYPALLNLINVPSLFAADPGSPQPYPWPGWGMHGPGFWWIFPLIFIVLMVVMCVAMMRGGGMGCMWRDRHKGGTESRDLTKRSEGDSSESALDILDKRFAKGEITKEEYEEMKNLLGNKTS
jgi:putative membrane protein